MRIRLAKSFCHRKAQLVEYSFKNQTGDATTFVSFAPDDFFVSTHAPVGATDYIAYTEYNCRSLFRTAFKSNACGCFRRGVLGFIAVVEWALQPNKSGGRHRGPYLEGPTQMSCTTGSPRNSAAKASCTAHDSLNGCKGLQHFKLDPWTLILRASSVRRLRRPNQLDYYQNVRSLRSSPETLVPKPLP